MDARTCGICGVGIDAHQAVRGGVCDGDDCRRKLAVRHAIERTAARNSRRFERLAALREELLADEPPAARDGLPLVVVPASSQAVVPLPRERREAFVAHLRGVIGDAFAALERGETPEDPWRAAARPVEPDERPFLGAACGLCRGYCCRLGYDSHAFLDVPAVAGYLRAHPGATPEEVLAAYLDRIPEASFEHGCIYQGDRGCRLDDDMRSGVCGWYLCDGLKSLREVLASGGPRRALLVADAGVTRAAVLDEKGLQPRPVPPQVRSVEELLPP